MTYCWQINDPFPPFVDVDFCCRYCYVGIVDELNRWDDRFVLILKNNKISGNRRREKIFFYQRALIELNIIDIDYFSADWHTSINMTSCRTGHWTHQDK